MNNKKLTFLSILLSVIILTGASCKNNSEYNEALVEKIQNSDCKIYYDGCNTCEKMGIEEVCTAKKCSEFQEPRCLDGNKNDAVAKDKLQGLDKNTTAHFNGLTIDGREQRVLINFFDYLHRNEFKKAVELFSPDKDTGWEVLRANTPAKDFGNKAKILENYCKAAQTCLRAKVLEVKEIENTGEYNLVVQFLNKDGSVYIFGPCCGATEEEMPSVDRFDYKVKKVGNTFKVVTPPLYRP